LMLDGLPGIVSVSAIQNGDLQYQAAPPVIRSFSINEKATQEIELSPIDDQPTTAPPLVLPTVTTSGLPIQYEIISGPATLQNINEVFLNGTEGTVEIQATQPGNEHFFAALPVEISFAVILLDTDFPFDNCMIETEVSDNPYIIGLNLGSIESTSENEGYADNTGQTTILRRQSILPMTVEIEQTVDAYVSVWIDYNRNGSFADVGEVIYEGIVLENTSNSLLESVVTVPSEARLGLTRMRVIAQKDDFANPCEPTYFGEVEDYGIYLEVVTNVSIEEEATLAIYPNPFDNQLTINWEISDYEVRIYNSIGQQTYHIKATTDDLIIDTNEWKSGIYVVKMFDKEGKTVSHTLLK